jgi:hypothetical protein
MKRQFGHCSISSMFECEMIFVAVNLDIVQKSIQIYIVVRLSISRIKLVIQKHLFMVVLFLLLTF